MNQRIQELAEQAGFNHMGISLVIGIEEYHQKFAELIVRECVEQASIGNGHGNNQWDRALTFSAKNIKEHFGVESA